MHSGSDVHQEHQDALHQQRQHLSSSAAGVAAAEEQRHQNSQQQQAAAAESALGQRKRQTLHCALDTERVEKFVVWCAACVLACCSMYNSYELLQYVQQL
jgi:small-conductance mechanosensitive channel